MMQNVQTKQNKTTIIVIIVITTIIICASASGAAAVPLVHIPLTLMALYIYISMLATSIFPFVYRGAWCIGFGLGLTVACAVAIAMSVDVGV